jgi:hypothetical protein
MERTLPELETLLAGRKLMWQIVFAAALSGTSYTSTNTDKKRHLYCYTGLNYGKKCCCTVRNCDRI